MPSRIPVVLTPVEVRAVIAALRDLPRLPEIADRCLWGTDWPGPGVPDLRRNVEDFLGLGLPEPVNRAILHGNAQRLFP